MVRRLLEAAGGLGEWEDFDEFAAVYQQLTAAGLEDEHCRRLLDEAAESLPPRQRRSKLQLTGFLARRIIATLPVLEPELLPRRIILVGPTGVGKTTTVAKLASFFQRRRGERVGIVSVDSFRLGAADQIRAYGRRLGMPVAVVDSHAAFVQAASEMADRERLIVDTTGRSHRDEAGLAALHQLLPGADRAVLLVLPAAVQRDDLLDILVQYRRFRPAALLFTKLDETTRYGSLASGAQSAELPLSFFTTGQLVPEDLEVASGERVASLLLGLGERG
jgi:flagellar biosynthesis protein FlhF